MASTRVLVQPNGTTLVHRQVPAATTPIQHPTEANGVGLPDKQPANTGSPCNGTSSNAGGKSAEALLEVRRRFLDWAQANPDKVNERDRDKLATDDWYLKRYLLARNRKVNDTLAMLRDTMEWRNEFGIHISEDAMFPLEFYKIGALFPYENDRKGNLVLYMRVKYHRKINEMVEVEKHFLVHTFEKIDRLTNGQGLTIVFDCQGAGMVNCDIDFLKFLISCSTEHAPVGLKTIIVYKLPWYLNTFSTLVTGLLPAYFVKRLKFCDDKSIREHIAPECLPDFMNGTCRRNYRWIPPGCPSVFKLANAHGISDAEIGKILPQFQALLDEAEEAIASSTYDDPPETVTRYINNPATAPTLLSDLALCHVGFSPPPPKTQLDTRVASTVTGALQPALLQSTNASSIIKIFPNQYLEFIYDAYNDVFHANVTLFNPHEQDSLAFKLMSNRPSIYSVKPARGVLAANSSVTLSIVLLDEHKSTDKFLIVAQRLKGEITSMTKAEFDLLWQQRNTDPQASASIKLESYLRKVVTAPPSQSTAIKNPQTLELVTTCRTLKRRQDLSLIINIILLVIIVNLILFN